MNRPFYLLARAVARVYYRLWHRMRIHGVERVPMEGPVLLVANHASFLDPPLVAIANRRYVFSLARSTLGHFPPARWILSGVATLFIDRDGSARQGIDVAVSALQAGRALAVFPEGTRSRDGEVGPFKRGILLILGRCPAAMVVPVGVRGTRAALPRGARFPRPRRCEVVFGEPIPAGEVLDPGGLDRLRDRVIALATGGGVEPDAGAVAKVESPQDSGNPGDAPERSTAEYRVPRSGPDTIPPMRVCVEGRPARAARPDSGDSIPRSSFNLLSFPRFS